MVAQNDMTPICIHTLVNEALLVSADALAEHVVGPALVGEHDGDEDRTTMLMTVSVYCEEDAL